MRVRLVIRMRLKDNVSSPCSIEKLVRAPFLIHYALNNDERATHSRFPLTNAMWRVRVRLTLMLAAAANATATPAPARYHWFPKVTLGVPFATPRTRRASQVIEWFSCLPTVAGWRMILGAGSGGEKMVRRMSATLIKLASSHRLSPVDGFAKRIAGGAERQKSRRHRADTCAPLSRQVSARFRRTAGRTHHFPPAPLHCTSISAVAGAARTYISVPFVPTAANCRDRQRQRCAQRFQRPRCSAYRPRPAIWPRDFVRPRHRNYGARLRLSPRTRQ